MAQRHFIHSSEVIDVVSGMKNFSWDCALYSKCLEIYSVHMMNITDHLREEFDELSSDDIEDMIQELKDISELAGEKSIPKACAETLANFRGSRNMVILRHDVLALIDLSDFMASSVAQVSKYIKRYIHCGFDFRQKKNPAFQLMKSDIVEILNLIEENSKDAVIKYMTLRETYDLQAMKIRPEMDRAFTQFNYKEAEMYAIKLLCHTNVLECLSN